MVNPILQADLINKNQILSDRMDVINGLMADASTNLNQHKQLLDDITSKTDSQDLMKKVVGDLGTTITALQTEARRVAVESNSTKSEAERRYAEMQSQLITASIAASAASGGGGGGSLRASHS